MTAQDTFAAGGHFPMHSASMAGNDKNKRMASCGSSKAAANHLIRNIAFDLGFKNIRVNGIAPGATRTDALGSMLNDDIEERMPAHTPIRRPGEPQDMANAALFLCFPAASWINGQIVTVSGGGVQELD
ncbi:SDR family oxidoreductase [Ensifer canadensis]